MDFSKYKYNPEDFRGMQFMSDDLTAFYRSFEAYKKEKAKSAWWELRDHWENLFFTIKHRELEGFFHKTPPMILETI